MSWKILVSAGLLCALASPAMAAPSAGATLLGLDTNGNWVWSVTATPDTSLFTGSPASGSMALEIGAAATQRNLVSAAKNATNFGTDNPGTPIGAGFPLLTNTTATGVQTLGNNVAINLGSDLFTTGGAKEAARIHVQGPTSSALSTTLTLSGAYSGNGRVAQGGVNTDTVTGANVKSVVTGNVNLDGSVGPADLVLLSGSWTGTGKHWQQGDLNGDGTVGPADLVLLSGNWTAADPNWTVAGSISLAPTPGAGAGAGSAVPEPASLALLFIGAGMALVGFRRRKPS